MNYFLLSLLTSLAIIQFPAHAAFTDVQEDRNTKSAINYLANADVLRGDPGGTFRPGAPINRAEFTAIVMRTLRNADAETSCDTKPTFKDVAVNSWYYQDVCEAFNEELIDGYSDQTFKPEQTITLEEAAKIVAISYGLDPKEVERGSPWYKPGLAHLASNSALPTFLPKLGQPLTREQMAEILFRMEVELDKPSLGLDDFDIPSEGGTRVKGNDDTRGEEESDIDYEYCESLLDKEEAGEEWTEAEEDRWYAECEDGYEDEGEEGGDVDYEYCDDLLEFEEEWTEEDEDNWYEKCEAGYEYEDDYSGSDDEDDLDFEMSESDCYDDEEYDPVAKMCYIEIECETDEECEAILSQYEGEFEEILDEEQDEDFGEFDYEGEDVNAIATYKVNEDTITRSSGGANGGVASWQSDEANHRELWDFYASLIPSELRTHVTALSISTDGKEGELAAVSAEDDLNSWTLHIDIADAFKDNGDTIDERGLSYSLIHEQMHLITLKGSEYTTGSSCTTYEIEEGCLKSQSILYRFYNKFWRQHASRLNDEDAMASYYSRNVSEFVSDYAATNPIEDAAESFAEFVFTGKPDSLATLADQKINFMYGESTLVELRNLLRNRLKNVVR